MNPVSLPDDTVLFDDQRYRVEISLMNSNGMIPIPNGTVSELIIEDNLYSIFYSARMIINSSENMLDNFTGSALGNRSSQTGMHLILTIETILKLR